MMINRLWYLFFLTIGLFLTVDGAAVEDPIAIAESCGITIDLRNPVYSDGVISTGEGGVISGPNLRIQAKAFQYTPKTKKGAPHSVLAVGDVMLEFGEYIFVGDRLEYNLETMTGIIDNGRSMVEPWYFGGHKIYLCSDGSYYIENLFITTSENVDADWMISAEEATLDCDSLLTAKNMKIRVLSVPVFWLPSFKMNLEEIFDSPIRYNVRWGSRQGHRFGLVYEVFSWQRLKTFLRLDYRLKRGPGGGIETAYKSEDENTHFDSISYVARDSSIIHPDQRFRYLFQGIGDTLLWDDTLEVHLSYDKFSDIDMPTDYYDRGLDLETAGRTELTVRRETEDWIANFISRVKLNNFQTLKQELPTFETAWRPFELADTGLIYNTAFNASFLDFSYGNNQLYVHDYTSTRIECTPSLYRPFQIQFLNVMPEIGAVGIAYGNSPNDDAQWLLVGKVGCSVNANITRMYDRSKHVITPYANYTYLSMPTVSPHNHYIFDIEDGWYRLSMLTFGVSQSLYHKNENGWIAREFYANLYANAFFNTHTFPQAIPKIYCDVIFNTLSTLRHSFYTGWDFMHQQLDHYNVRTEWTYNPNFALAFEYRHRSSYDWRKADHTNFILDSYRSVTQLRDSQLSDRRDTLLLHMFFRFHPSWAIQIESRSGWNRIREPAYNEFEIDLLGTLRSAWNLKLSYQHREDDDRVSVYMNIGIKRPDCSPNCPSAPCLGL